MIHFYVFYFSFCPLYMYSGTLFPCSQPDRFLMRLAIVLMSFTSFPFPRIAWKSGSVVQNVSCLLVCGMICIGGMVTGLWNGGMYSMVGRRNDTMRLRMRTGMNGGMDEILMASLDLDVCIYNMLYVDADENRQARQNEQIRFY